MGKSSKRSMRAPRNIGERLLNNYKTSKGKELRRQKKTDVGSSVLDTSRSSTSGGGKLPWLMRCLS